MSRPLATGATSVASSAPPEGDDGPLVSHTLGPGPDAELTWLLHRAAQRMRAATSDAAEEHGLTLRRHIILSAMHLAPGMTQVELGRAVGMDKTTLTSELDHLERLDLVRRSVDPRDRRARNLTLTEEGERVRQLVSAGTERAEREALEAFDMDDIARLRRMLYVIIEGTQDPGTCL
ncbi:MarR family winged helix-turn-helix transcriptional regulator [Arsenicicoccus bolidensis]|uniref:MarR family transcriptional regulator n=1 Tax=Arsenicicoccus bolidensis TaxID=229480 RepID=A0ABS9Q5I4_9MICO|nr:MarR family transcriptional regulator [Arsenicicoccus bolidensis]MCG7322363.1 MarR family transcriptional regulator [Arsenicicoccus bolidensis]